MLIFEIASLLINSETENLRFGTFIVFVAYIFFIFVVGELKRICANLQFAISI